MAVVRKIRRGGANIVVEANAEILFMPGGQVFGWTRRFKNRIETFTAAYAPANKRPRWSHYGKPLKSNIKSSEPRFRGNGKDTQRVYAAVGSSTPYAYYVDQGTGVYAGNGPYEAKILPPWTRGDASLYEHTWRPGGPQGSRVKPVLIKGQKGQFFFDKGLKRAFQFMLRRSYQVSADPRVGRALASFPEGTANFLGNTPVNAAFRSQLEEWRAWRDEAFKSGEGLNRSPYDAAKAARAAERRNAKKHGLPKRQQADLDVAIKLQNDAAERRRKAALRQRQEDKERERAKSLILKKKKAEKAEREAAEDERKRNEIRANITARKKREATDIARKYANSGYTGVRLRTDFNKAKTEIVGFTVLYTTPAGEPGSTKVH